MHKLLVVDDDSEIRENVRDLLSGEFEVVEASDGGQCLSYLEKSLPSAVLLDLTLPVHDGMEVCRRIKSDAMKRNLPVIVLTGHLDEASAVRAFECGADDYVVKPFRAKELKARIRAKLRDPQRANEHNAVSVGDISLNLDTLEAVIAGETQRVTTLEFRILQHFVENAGKVVSRESLLATAWKGVKVSDRTVDTHVVWIRRKLANSRMNIVTIYGAGYRLLPSPSA